MIPETLYSHSKLITFLRDVLANLYFHHRNHHFHYQNQFELDSAIRAIMSVWRPKKGPPCPFRPGGGSELNGQCPFKHIFFLWLSSLRRPCIGGDDDHNDATDKENTHGSKSLTRRSLVQHTLLYPFKRMLKIHV